jgi:spore maturation protein CgeB
VADKGMSAAVLGTGPVGVRGPWVPRTVLVYPAYNAARVAEEEAFAERLRSAGHPCTAFGIACADGWWDFPKLDRAMRERDPWLLAAYERLGGVLAGADLLFAAGGSMLHPDLLAGFHGCKVMVCGDDPENSERLSRPVAAAFDVAFTTNIPCVDAYRAWGCADAAWIHPVLRPEWTESSLTQSRILHGERSVDVAFFGERVFGLSDRHRRIDDLQAAFPQAVVGGRGTVRGFVSEAAVKRTLLRSKLGWNLHNSVGPCNTRLLSLPALGVLQVCDNRDNLGRIFELGREVVGFDSLAECIDATRYYLAHDEERRAIAARGFARVQRDYTEARFWDRVMERAMAWFAARTS